MLSEKPWNPLHVVRLLTGLFVSVAVGAFVVELLNPVPGEPLSGPMQFKATMVGALFFHGAALGLIHWLLRENRLTWSQAFGFDSPRLGWAMILAAVLVVLMLPISWYLSQLSAWFLEAIHVEPKIQPTVQTLQQEDLNLSQTFFFGIVALALAPVVEELLFRGILYPTIKQSGYPRLALWVTALLFAGSHMNLMTLLPLTLLALVLTWLYEETNNLFAPIASHSLFNAVNFFWLLHEKSIQRFLG